MKKFLLPLVAMLFCMTACNKDNEGILTLEVEQYASNNKLHLDDDYAVWDNNDAVWVNGITYEVSVSGNTATISGVADADTYTALYPADWANASGTNLTYPATQTYNTNGGKQIIDAPMAAYSDGGNLKFHNLGSILAVNVSGMTKVEKIEVIADGTTKINGTCALSNVTTDSPALGTPTTGTNTTTLVCNGVSVPSTGMTFYIALPPVSAKLTIKVDDGYSIYTRTQGSTMSFASNHGYNVPFEASTASAEQYAPTRKQIWYRTNNSSTISNMGNLGTPVSNEWNNELEYFVATFSSDLTTIPEGSFKYKNTLTEIVLPEGITTIGEEVFYNCVSLSNIVLPYSLTEIQQYTFWYCDNLLTIEIPNPNAKLANNLFYDGGIQTVILHNNNIFSNSDISTLIWHIQGSYEMNMEMFHNNKKKAWEQALADRDNSWSFNNDNSASFVYVYVPDVNTCTNISYDMGFSEYLNTNYIYYPWQYLVDQNKIQLLPLSSLQQ